MRLINVVYLSSYFNMRAVTELIYHFSISWLQKVTYIHNIRSPKRYEKNPFTDEDCFCWTYADLCCSLLLNTWEWASFSKMKLLMLTGTKIRCSIDDGHARVYLHFGTWVFKSIKTPLSQWWMKMHKETTLAD